MLLRERRFEEQPRKNRRQTSRCREGDPDIAMLLRFAPSYMRPHKMGCPDITPHLAGAAMNQHCRCRPVLHVIESHNTKRRNP